MARQPDRRVLFTIPWFSLRLAELEDVPPEERQSILMRCIDSREMRAFKDRCARLSLYCPLGAFFLGLGIGIINRVHLLTPVVLAAVAWCAVNLVWVPIGSARIMRRLLKRECDECPDPQSPRGPREA
jgi:hypothetical protein